MSSPEQPSRFLDLGTQEKPRRFLVVDWTEVETKFKNNHGKFLEMIRSVNLQIPSLESNEEENSEKNCLSQMPTSIGFNLSVEGKKEEIQREKEKEFIEYERAEKPKQGNLAPDEGSEKMDILEEIMLGHTKPAETKPSSENIRVDNNDRDLDVNSNPSSEENEKQKKDSLSDEKPASVPSSPVEVPSTQTVSPDAYVPEEFNFAKWAKVECEIKEIMGMVSESKIDAWMSSFVQYAINLNLDEQRVRPEILANTLVTIQGKKDPVHSILLELVKFGRWMKEAEEFLKTSGVSCSKAGSDSKRMGDVRIVIPEFFKLLAKVEATYEIYERIYKHLCNQADTVSRLVTTQQNEMRYKEIFSGRVESEQTKPIAVPFDGPYQRMPESNPSTVPNESPVPERNTNGLESFAKPKTRPNGSKLGTVDFEVF